MHRSRPGSIAIVFLFGLVSLHSQAWADDVVKELFQRKFVTAEYDSLLSRFFTMAKDRGDLPYDFAVNTEFREGILNVYVLESDYRSQGLFIESIGVPYDHALTNILSVAPGKILVGENLLADLVLRLYNANFSFMQAFDIFRKTQDLKEFDRAGVLSNYLEFGNVFNSIKYESLSDHPTKLAPIMVQAFTEVASKSKGDTPYEIGYEALLFVFAHEVAHLAKHKSGGLISIWKIAEEYRRNAMREEERRADDEAHAIVTKSLLRSESRITGNVSLVAWASYLRDYLLVSLFDGVRDVDARELFLTLHQDKCKPERLGVYGNRLDNIEFMKTGYWNVFPILSQDEYRKVQVRVSKNELMATHEHSFLRAARITNEFAMPNAKFKDLAIFPISSFERFYRDLIANRPYIHADHLPGTTSILEKDFLKSLPPSVKLEASPACDSGLVCMTGRLDEGYVDVVLQKGYVKYATIYFPIERMSMDGVPPEKFKLLSTKLINMTILYVGLRHHTIDPKILAKAGQEERVLDEFSQLRLDVLNCGFHSKVYRNNKNALEVSTLRTKKWVGLKLFPAKVEFPQLVTINSN